MRKYQHRDICSVVTTSEHIVITVKVTQHRNLII